MAGAYRGGSTIIRVVGATAGVVDEAPREDRNAVAFSAVDARGHEWGDLTFDHVVPRADGGGTSWTNIVAACVPCNSRKGSSRSMKPKVQPRAPTLYEMARKQPIDLSRLHRSSLDYLYWLEGLQTD